MFNSVSREEFDREHEQRVKSDTAAEFAVDSLHTANEHIARLTALLESERVRHDAKVTDLLDRFSPKPVLTFTGNGVISAAPAPPLSSQQLSRLPAIGKRGVRERNAHVREAEEREELAAKEKDTQTRLEGLTEAELRSLDSSLKGEQ